MHSVVHLSDNLSVEALRKQHVKLLSFFVSVLNQGQGARNPSLKPLVENKHHLEVVGGVVWGDLELKDINKLLDFSYLDEVADRTKIRYEALRYFSYDERYRLEEIRTSLEGLQGSQHCLTYHNLFRLSQVYNNLAEVLDGHRNQLASKILKLSEEAPSPTTWAVASTRTKREVRGELRKAEREETAIAAVLSMVRKANEECLRVMSRVPVPGDPNVTRELPQQFESIQNKGSILGRISDFMSSQFLLRSARDIQTSLAVLDQNEYQFGRYNNEFKPKDLDLLPQHIHLKNFGISYPLRSLLNLERDLNSGAVVSLIRLKEGKKLVASYSKYLDGLGKALIGDGDRNKWFLRLADKVDTINRRVGKLGGDIDQLLH